MLSYTNVASSPKYNPGHFVTCVEQGFPPPPLDLLIKKLFVCYFNWNVDYSSRRQKVVHIPYQASH